MPFLFSQFPGAALRNFASLCETQADRTPFQLFLPLNHSQTNFMVDVILDLQWGDEGKGKIVDYFASRYDLIARFQGGPNAGHTLYVGDRKVVLHQIPSGIFHEGTVNLIGNGVVLDP